MSGQLGDLVISLSADMARFQADMGKANKITQDTMSKIQSDVTKGIEGIQASFKLMSSIASGAMAIAAGGAMFKGMVDTTKEVTSEVVKLSKVFGVSAEEASVMRIALDDAFITVDDAVGASDRLTRASIKNADAFKKAGIDIRDSNGNLKDSMTVMMETNNYLKTLKEGKDRDTAAMALYGKGWRELSGILRLNSDSMKDAKFRAEELHLIIGADGIEATKKYKSAMKDLVDVAESFKVRAGSELIPILTSIAVEMERIALAGSKLPKTLDDRLLTDQMHEAVGFWEKLKQAQRIGLSRGLGQFLPEEERQKVYEERKQENLDPQMARLAYDKKNKGNKADGRAPDMSVDKEASLWASAHDKYLAYLKAFSAKEAEIIKMAAAEQLLILRNGYEWGLIDQTAYLKQKHELTEREISDEIRLKQAEVAKYGKEADASKGKTDAKGASAYHAALEKQAGAQKDLIALEGKLKSTRVQNSEETTRAVYELTRGYQEQQYALADYQQDYVRAAAIRETLENESIARKQLERNAAAGDLEAQRAVDAAKIISLGKVQQAIEQARQKEYNRINDAAKRQQGVIGGDNYGSRLGAVDDSFQEEQTRLQAQYNAKLILEEEFNAKMLQVKQQYAAEQSAIGMSMAEDSIGIMKQAFADNKAMSILALAAEAAIAVARIMMNAEVAKSAAIATAQMAGPLAPAMEAAAIARITAGEMMSIGMVGASTAMSAMQIAGRRAGGGPVRGGETYLVGEKGPELFTAGASGHITPNDKIGGISAPIVYATIDARGADQGVELKIRAGMQQAIEAAYSKVKRSMDRGGELAYASGRIK